MADKVHSKVRDYKLVRSRLKMRGTPDRPRLTVYKSRKHISAQVVDDLAGRVLVGAATYSKEIQSLVKGKKNMDACRVLGKIVAERCQSKGISKVCFDRSGYIYHGKISALADAAREGGLQF